MARPAPVPAGRRRARRRAHLPRHAEGQLSAVRLLAGDAVLRAGAVGGGEVLRAARHGGEELHARLVAGGHRRLHADREQSRTRAWCSSATRTSAASPIRPRASPATGRPACSPTPARPCRSSTGWCSSREKEGIPYWNKFLQGYYDSSGILGDTFDQAVRVSIEGDAGADARDGGARHPAAHLGRHHDPATSAFNWLDSIVGGGGAVGERARKLRQAISIAVDWEELISIFAQRPRHGRRRARSRRASSASARGARASTR